MTIEEMRQRKKELGLSNQEISTRSGVPFSTVQKILSGATDSPRQKTVEALEKVFLPPGKTLYPETGYRQVDRIAKAAPAYQIRKQGEYTVEDYYAIPDAGPHGSVGQKQAGSL